MKLLTLGRKEGRVDPLAWRVVKTSHLGAFREKQDLCLLFFSEKFAWFFGCSLGFGQDKVSVFPGHLTVYRVLYHCFCAQRAPQEVLFSPFHR